MRVVYYSRPCFLETSLHYVRALSSLAEVHFILEVAPEGWMSAGFDADWSHLAEGIVPAAGLFEAHFPPAASDYWKGCAGFWLAVHTQRKTIHPRTWLTSHHVLRHIRKLGPDVLHIDDRSLRLGLAMS